jgi:hypothetical protein
MLKNTKLIIAAASVLITGIGASAGAYLATRNNADAAVSSEVMSMAESKTASIDTTPIDEAVSAGIEQINSVVSEAIQQIESKVAEKTSSVAPMESKSALHSAVDVPLNVETQRGDGTLTFVRFETRPDSDEAVFYYETSEPRAKMPVVGQTLLVGKSGTEYKTDTFYGTGNKGQVAFQNITDFSDLSTVTLTYTFEGFDPVTVTIEIPIE